MMLFIIYVRGKVNFSREKEEKHDGIPHGSGGCPLGWETEIFDFSSKIVRCHGCLLLCLCRKELYMFGVYVCLIINAIQRKV